MAGATSDAAERVEDLLEKIRSSVGIDATIEVSEDSEGISADFVGEALGLLIGHHGQTIDAIQHLAYRIAFRGVEERGRVGGDAAGDRGGRAALRRADADRAADVAIREGRAVALEAMSALER